MCSHHIFLIPHEKIKKNRAETDVSYSYTLLKNDIGLKYRRVIGLKDWNSYNPLRQSITAGITLRALLLDVKSH